MVLAMPMHAAADDRDAAEERYRACMTLVDSDPQEARDQAIAWRKAGGGNPAGHCAAAAEFALGRYVAAAEELEALAGGGARRQNKKNSTDSPGDRALRASLWAQAAHAWLSADRPERAETAAGEAARLAPRDPLPLLLRARALAAQQRMPDAVSDLDRALTLDPGLADAYVFRASALRQQQGYQAAAADLEAALAIDPRHPEALLERGILRRLQGDDAGARADWRALLSAAPQTPAAEQARVNLEKMDAGG
jgi:tetratricopeptide (TPR) repeat protein